MIIDECAYIDDEVIDICLPFVDANKAPIVMISTPYYRAGSFYDYYMDGIEKKDPYITSFNWSAYDTSVLLSHEKLEFYRKKVARDVFQTDYLGEFAELGSGIFGNVASIINNNPRKDLSLYMGVDWSSGTNGDETVVTIFNSEHEMVFIDGFNNLDATQTINRIISIVEDFRPKKITVESNSIGRVFYDILNKALNKLSFHPQLSLFNTTNESKNKIVQNFQLAVQNQEVTILQDEKLLNQLSHFESKLTNTGKITYAATRNGHDDRVMSMLIAYNSITSGNYSVL